MMAAFRCIDTFTWSSEREPGKNESDTSRGRQPQLVAKQKRAGADAEYRLWVLDTRCDAGGNDFQLMSHRISPITVTTTPRSIMAGRACAV